MGESTYKCTIEDCLNGLYFGIQLGWYEYSTFNTKTYERYEKVENGDMNWIVPNKFLAFAGPANKKYDEDGYRQYTPEDYNPVFETFGIKLVVRLNKKRYDEKIFSDYGFKVLDIPFEDGTIPPQDIIDKFIAAAEACDGGIAIHCKAGLGRTGTLIGLYTMKHYGFPAAAFIGWARICRPGSVLGPQQHYLNEAEEDMIKAGGSYDKRDELISKMGEMNIEERKVEMSPFEKKVSKHGDIGQADRLKQQKRARIGK
jgi:cell division cycle 14